MRRDVCWFCHYKTNMTQRGQVHVALDADDNGNMHVQGAFSCDSCGHLSIALTTVSPAHLRDGLSPEPYLLKDVEPVWLPVFGVGKAFPDVPAHLADAADEVHRCLSIGADRAAVGLARAVVEASAKEKGITKGRLAEKIDALEAQGDIRRVIREAAHEVRIDGNGVAHGDLADQAMSADEARDVVALMDELLLEVFQTPARMERVRASRASRSTASDGSDATT